MDTNKEESSTDFSRLGYAVVLCVVTLFAQDMVVGVILLSMFIQLLLSLLNGTPNVQILDISRSVGVVISSSFAYASFLTDEKPFPLSSWPSRGNTDDSVSEVVAESESATKVEEKEAEIAGATQAEEEPASSDDGGANDEAPPPASDDK